MRIGRPSRSSRSAYVKPRTANFDATYERAVRVRLPAGDRAHVDDVAAVAEVRQAEARHPHQPGDVRRDHGRLVLFGRLVDRDAAERQARVVEEDVEPAELVHRAGDEALAALRRR